MNGLGGHSTAPKGMEILETRPVYHAYGRAKTYFTVYERKYHNRGVEGSYFFVSRGDKLVPHEEKQSDAVVIVAVHQGELDDRLVLTSEFRVPIGCRELSFPAGLIDKSDYHPDESLSLLAIKAAAVREMREETGYKFEFQAISKPNLYSSAGLTNESVCYAFGTVSGEPNKSCLEDSEDIQVQLYTSAELKKLLADPKSGYAFSKTAWPFMHLFAETGLCLHKLT